jgi:hypothetical protein
MLAYCRGIATARFPELDDAQLEALQHYVRQKARTDLAAAGKR